MKNVAAKITESGNPNVMLCERGIRTFEEEVRFTLCLGSVPALREMTHLPIIVDPSHAGGRRDLVRPLSLAALAAGPSFSGASCWSWPPS